MSGALTYLGGMTIGDCLPTFLGVYAGVVAELEAKLAGALALHARLTITPPTLSAQLEAAIALVATLRAGIALGIPGVSFQVDALIALIASINAQLGILLALDVAFGTAGVHAYSYDGDVVSVGPTWSSVGIPGAQPSDHCNAIILATTLPATWAAMGTVFIT